VPAVTAFAGVTRQTTHRPPASRLVLDHLAVVTFDDAAEAAFRRWLADELLPREPAPAALEAEIGAGSPAAGPLGPARTGLTVSCAPPAPRTTMRLCGVWPIASTPARADDSGSVH
jgi:hypothetical protein